MIVESTCFSKKIGSLINSLREKNSSENYNVKDVIMFSYKKNTFFLNYTQTNCTTGSKTCRTQ